MAFTPANKLTENTGFTSAADAIIASQKKEPSNLDIMGATAKEVLLDPFTSRINAVSDNAMGKNYSPVSTGIQTGAAIIGGAYDVLGKGVGSALSAIPQVADAVTFDQYGLANKSNVVTKGVGDIIGEGVGGIVKGAKYLANKVMTPEQQAKVAEIARNHPEATANAEALATIVLEGKYGQLKDVGGVLAKGGKIGGLAATKVPGLVADAGSQVMTNASLKAVDSLEETYKALNSGTTLGKRTTDKLPAKTEAMNKAGTTGNSPMRVLAEDGIIPQTEGTKLSTYDQAQEYINSIKHLNEANKLALHETGLSSALLSLDTLKADAISLAKTPENINAGRFDSMAKDIDKEFELLKTHYPSGNIPINVVDEIKSARWDNVFKNKSLIEADVLKKDSEYAIAKSLQRNIEEAATQAGNTEVAQLNRVIGDKLGAAKFLEDLNGKTIKGGRLLKYLTTAIGAGTQEGTLGMLVSGAGGNFVGQMMISSQVSNPIKRLLLRNLAIKDPESYTKTLEWLTKQNIDKEARLLLPAPNGGPIVNEGKPIIVPRGGFTDYNNSMNEVRGAKITRDSTPMSEAQLVRALPDDLKGVNTATKYEQLTPKEKSIIESWLNKQPNEYIMSKKMK